VGGDTTKLFVVCETAQLQCKTDCLQPQEIIKTEQHRYDLGVIALDGCRPSEMWPVLAKCRDILTRHFIVVAPDTTDWPAAEFLALGMTQTDTANQTDYVVYEYDIASYKTTPDWLSAKGWANPERWEKERW
jgi:hypothetical protein